MGCHFLLQGSSRPRDLICISCIGRWLLYNCATREAPETLLHRKSRLSHSVQFSRSVVSNSLRPHEPQHARPPCPSPTPGVHPNPLSLVMPSNHLILYCPLLLLLPIPPSIKVFSNESALLIRWPKYWSFSFSISPSDEHPGLIFRMDWLDLLAVQGTLKSILQNHSSKTPIFRCSGFFIHDHWKNHSLD